MIRETEYAWTKCCDTGVELMLPRQTTTTGHPQITDTRMCAISEKIKQDETVTLTHGQ